MLETRQRERQRSKAMYICGLSSLCWQTGGVLTTTYTHWRGIIPPHSETSKLKTQNKFIFKYLGYILNPLPTLFFYPWQATCDTPPTHRPAWQPVCGRSSLQSANCCHRCQAERRAALCWATLTTTPDIPLCWSPQHTHSAGYTEDTHNHTN